MKGGRAKQNKSNASIYGFPNANAKANANTKSNKKENGDEFPSRRQRQPYDTMLTRALGEIPFSNYRHLLVLTNDEVNRALAEPNARRTGAMPYHHLQDYQDSFDDIISFREKNYPKDEDCEFDVVLMHDNADGVFSTFAYWLWKTKQGQNLNRISDFIVLTSKPELKERKPNRKTQNGGSPNYQRGYEEGAPPSQKLRSVWRRLVKKRVLVLDLNYSHDIQDWFHENCERVLFIDDHSEGRQEPRQEPWLFVGENHSSCAYAYKFFFPHETVPLLFVYIDNQDKKLYSPFLPYPAPLITYITSHFIKRITNPGAYAPESDLWKHLLYLMTHPEGLLLAIKTGSNMNELKNLEKDLAVKHACMGRLHIPGLPEYKVGILNLDHDVLTKATGKEILTLAKKVNDELDLSILWGQHYNKDMYHLTVTKLAHRDDIDMTRDVLPALRKYFPGASGGGHKYELSLMFPQYRRDGRDTKDLLNKMFEKTHCRSMSPKQNSNSNSNS